MPPTDDASLNLRDVQERFDTSTAALDEVQQRLRALTELQEQRTAAVDGLEQASAELSSLTSAATDSMAALQAAQASAIDAFQAMQSLADGTQLGEIRDGVASVDQRVTTTEAAVAALTDTFQQLDAKLDERETIAGELETTKSELADLRARFEKLKDAAGARVLRRAGLEP